MIPHNGHAAVSVDLLPAAKNMLCCIWYDPRECVCRHTTNDNTVQMESKATTKPVADTGIGY